MMIVLVTCLFVGNNVQIDSALETVEEAVGGVLPRQEHPPLRRSTLLRGQWGQSEGNTHEQYPRGLHPETQGP